MKKGWPTKPLGEVCEVFADGDWVESKDQSSEGIRLIQTGNVGEGVFKDRAEKARYISEATFKRLRCTEIVEGDCLVSRLPDPVGRSCILPDTGERMITAVDCSILRFNPKQLLPTFFNLYSQSYDYLTTVAKECTGTTRNRISRSNLGLTPIPVPPLAEQQRIVGLLDEAFEGLATAKANAEKNLQNARALFESHLQSVFTQRGPGWVETTLENCCEQIFAGGDVPKDRLSEERTPKFGVPIYSNGEKNDGLYGFTDIARVTKPSITVSARGTLGFTAIRTEPFLPVVRLIVLVPDETQITLSFLYYAVVGMDFGNTGTSIPQLTVPNFKESKLHVPSLLEQEAIVEKLDALSEETQRLARLYERKHAALEALKKSLLHQAFTGEL